MSRAHDRPGTAPARVDAEIRAAARVDKPWGHERVFAGGDHGYVGKLIEVLEGQALSLQLHEHKDETMCVVSGRARLEHGATADALHVRELRAGDAIHLPAGVLHRLTAISDVLLVEASTAGTGWNEDVVRLDDRYGRVGTTAP